MVPIFKPAPYKPIIKKELGAKQVTYDTDNKPIYVINLTTGRWRKNLFNKDGKLIYSEFSDGTKYKDGTPI